MSKDWGLKVSLPGADINTAPLSQLVVDTNYPFPKCDLRIKPKNYGLLNISVSSMPLYPALITIYNQPHTYNYIPQFLVAWYYGAGTDPLGSSNITFGIGDINATGAFVNNSNQENYGFYIAMYCDTANFNITGTTYGSAAPGPITNTSFQVRFYIFADDFSGN